MYGWIITRDHLDGKDVTVKGPGGLAPELEAKLDKGEGEAFKIYDDDNELYYTGKIVGDYDGFEPLDDFCTPDSGCTAIKIDGEFL